VKARLLRIAKLLAYPAFYLFCLALFGYLKFPYNRLKDRVVAEFDKHAKPGQRLEIGKLSSYWFSGIEVSGVKLHLPAEEAPAAGFPGAADFSGGSSSSTKDSVLAIDEAHARVRLLPLLIGRVRLDFWASAFGGELKGTAPVGSAKGNVEFELDHVDISKVEPLAQAIGGIPIKGIATGKLELEAPDGKFNKANGTFDLTISDVVVSDGKTKIAGLLELPPAKLGEIVLKSEAKDGTLKITQLSANGVDLEILGDGKISLREPWMEAIADLYVRFKFTDAYRGKSSTTKALLGDPASAGSHGLIDTQVPKMSRARRPDGFYGWHIFGPLKKLRFEPSNTDAGGAAATLPTTPRRPMRPLDNPVRPHPGAVAGEPASPAPEPPTPLPSPPPVPAAAAPAVATPAPTPAPEAPHNGALRVPAVPMPVPTGGNGETGAPHEHEHETPQ
jgi:type II secretion system protein N